MRDIQGIEMDHQTREEQLPGFTPGFPYTATCVRLDQNPEPFVPWHWHKAVELFYMETGCLEYEIPGGKVLFPEGTGGLVNCNVLHMTRVPDSPAPTTQKLHIFDPALLSGPPGGRIEQTYFLPMTADPSLEILRLSPGVPEQARILSQIREAFSLDEQAVGYEIFLQRALLDIWFQLYQLYQASAHPHNPGNQNISAVKTMMSYIHAHLTEPIPVRELAQAAFLSERECYRVFQECLHTTPARYITTCRLQRACRMLLESHASVTEIAYACGFGSGAYFSRVFTREIGRNPNQYRSSWQNKTNHCR